MANTKEIKRRINAVENTQQITKAMEAVSAAKLRRAQEQAVAARPYSRRLAETLRRLAATGAKVEHPLLSEPENDRIAYIVITADRGLAGSYNAGIIRHTASRLQETPDAALICVGRKGYDYFRRRAEVLHHYIQIGEEARVDLAEEIADTAAELYVNGNIGEVRLVYTEFISAISQKVTEQTLLPIAAPTVEERGAAASAAAEAEAESYIFVPSAEELIRTLLPKLVRNQMYQALLESKASEHGARMTAMRSASDNAEEMIEKLNLDYNRARQAAITTEIAEIVGGAEALSG